VNPVEPGRTSHWHLVACSLSLLALSGCAYSFTPSRLPGHIRTVAIPTFQNHTAEPGLEREVTDRVTAEFIRDNTLSVVPQERADSGIYGQILSYENRVFGYNAEAQTEEYEVIITIRVEFKDLVRRKTLWTEKSIVGRNTYFVVDTTGQEAETEVEGRQEAIERMASDILNRAVRSWS
jgi:hypothetical protein